MEKAKRPRAKNFTNNEKEILVDCVKPFVKVIECNETNKKCNEDKEAAWIDITTNYNAQSTNPRDAKSLKSCYQHLKMSVKKENAEFKRQKFATGGGSEPHELDPTSVKLLSMLGSQVLPLTNLFDSGSDYHHDSVDDSQSSSVIGETLQKEVISSGTHNIDDNTHEITLSDIVLQKIRVPAKRKAPPSVTKVGEISEYVHAKKMRLEDRTKTEDELVDLKRENYIKQNMLLDKQLETANLEKEAVELEIIIKKTQQKYEDTRLQQITGAYSFAA